MQIMRLQIEFGNLEPHIKMELILLPESAPEVITLHTYNVWVFRWEVSDPIFI